MDSQGEKFPRYLAHPDDLRLKCCIQKEDSQITLTGRSQYMTDVTLNLTFILKGAISVRLSSPLLELRR